MPARQSSNRLQQLIVRAAEDDAPLVAAVRAVAQRNDVSVTVSDATVMTEVVAHESAPWRFLVRMFIAFAAVAGGPAAIYAGWSKATTAMTMVAKTLGG